MYQQGLADQEKTPLEPEPMVNGDVMERRTTEVLRS